GLISVYQTWMLGNAVWDSLPAVVRYARLAVRHAPVALEAGRAVVGRARERATARLRELRAAGARRAAEVGGRVRGVADAVVRRLPGTGSVRDRIRQVGGPVRLPAVPL